MIVEAHFLSSFVKHKWEVIEGNDKEIRGQWITLAQATSALEEAINRSTVPHSEASNADTSSNPWNEVPWQVKTLQAWEKEISG